jgi:hypothetical protein
MVHLPGAIGTALSMAAKEERVATEVAVTIRTLKDLGNAASTLHRPSLRIA